jgi:cytochrome c-type biogenesis protein CcmH/NrfG
MESESTTAANAIPTLRAAQVYGMATVCLAAGLTIGYFLRGSQTPAAVPQHAAGGASVPSSAPIPVPSVNVSRQTASAQPQSSLSTTTANPHAAMGGRMPSLEEMRQMADRQAQPLIEKLKSDPNNSAALIQLGAIYHTTHRFKEAAACYAKAIEIDPKNVAVRTKLASSLYRSGDVDGAIAQLNRALTYDPKDADALFDLGMIRLQGKQDGKGAVAAWQKLLKSNPQLSADRKAQVQKLMADVMTTLGDQHRIEGATGK